MHDDGSRLALTVGSALPTIAEGPCAVEAVTDLPFLVQQPSAGLKQAERVHAGALSLRGVAPVADPARGVTWQVASGRRKSRWHAAECQRRLAAVIWDRQRLALRAAGGALRIQSWWRSSLAWHRRARLRGDVLLATRHVCRSAYAAAALEDPLLPRPVESAPSPDACDGVLLDEAILRARGEESAIQSALEPVLHGARRALLRIDDGAGGKPRCPAGHELEAVQVPRGATCRACGRVALSPSVVFRCSAAGCFTSCARASGCAPRSLVMVMSALDAKFGLCSERWTDKG